MYVWSGFDTSNSNINFKAQLQELKKLELKIFLKNMIFDDILIIFPNPSSSQDYPKMIQKSKTCGHKAMTWWSGILKIVVSDAYKQVVCMTPFLEQSVQYPMRQTIFGWFFIHIWLWHRSTGIPHPARIIQKITENDRKCPQGHDMMIWKLKNRYTRRVSKSWPRILSFF